MTRGIQSAETGSDLFFLRKGCRANEEIAAAKSKVLEGISYFIGTGTDTKLWIDPWLNGSPLIHQPSRSHPTAVERFQSVSSS